jgi:hypothetical protein
MPHLIGRLRATTQLLGGEFHAVAGSGHGAAATSQPAVQGGDEMPSDRIVEVEAFDTTHIEVRSDDRRVLRALQACLGGELVPAEDRD